MLSGMREEKLEILQNLEQCERERQQLASQVTATQEAATQAVGILKAAMTDLKGEVVNSFSSQETIGAKQERKVSDAQLRLDAMGRELLKLKGDPATVTGTAAMSRFLTSITHEPRLDYRPVTERVFSMLLAAANDTTRPSS